MRPSTTGMDGYPAYEPTAAYRVDGYERDGYGRYADEGLREERRGRPDSRFHDGPVDRWDSQYPGDPRDRGDDWDPRDRGDGPPVADDAAQEDARLLGELAKLVASPSLVVRGLFLIFGFSAISALALAYAEIVPLPVGASVILLPAVVGSVLLGRRYPDWGWRALVGYSSGLVATAIYDCVRLGLFELGFWDDPIPHIGTLLLGEPAPGMWWGYLWRMLGNGAGMGMAYAMLPWRGVVSGIVYGTAVCLGLLATLFFAPVSQTHFFPLNFPTIVGATVGHWVYGAVLGYLVARRIPPASLSPFTQRLRRAFGRPLERGLRDREDGWDRDETYGPAPVHPGGGRTF